MHSYFYSFVVGSRTHFQILSRTSGSRRQDEAEPWKGSQSYCCRGMRWRKDRHQSRKLKAQCGSSAFEEPHKHTHTHTKLPMKDDSRLVSCIAVKTKSQSFGARAYVMLLIQDGLWVSSLCLYSGSSKPACPPLNFHLLARMSGPSSSSSLDSSSFNFTSKFCVNSFLSHSAI